MRDWLKTGAQAVCRFKRGTCWKRGGGVFWGEMIPHPNAYYAWPRRPHPFLTMTIHKLLKKLLASLTLYHYSINSFLWLILPILESIDQKGNTHFLAISTPLLQLTLNFHEFVSACKKSSLFHDFILHLIYKSCNLIGQEQYDWPLAHILGTRFFSNI